MLIPKRLNYHVFIVKHILETKTKSAKVKLKSERFNHSIYLPYTNHPGASSPALDTALLYLANKGYDIVGQGESQNHFYIISSTFEPLK